ncbi:MAG: chromosome segregation protein SMC, partial [Bryobacteraceae bacterium]
EVSRQVNSLKRQAAKAKRYEELRGEMAGHLRTSLAGRYQVLETEAAKLIGDLKTAADQHQELSQSVAQKETEQTALQEQCYRTEAELTQARQQLADKQLDAERTRGRLELQAKQIGGIEQRLATGESETQDLDRRQSETTQQLAGHKEAIAVLDQDAEAARQRLAERNAEREQLQNALRERERAMEQARQGVLRLLGEASQLKNQLAQVESHLGAIGRDSQRLQRDEEMAQADIIRLDSAKSEMSSRLSARQLELQSLAERRREVGEDLNVRRSQIAESRRTLDNVRSEYSKHKARKDSLEEILSHRAYTTESVKRLFTAIEHGKVEGFKPAGVLADFVEVTDPAFEKATEEFLHEELEYVVVKDWGEADQGVALMRGDVDGRATFLVHPEAEAATTDLPSISSEGIAARLSDVLRLTNGLTHAPAGLIPRLSRCYIANDKVAAQSLAVQNPDCYFLLPDGVSYHGHAVSGGKKTGGGPLALKRELRELTALVHVKQAEVDETTSTLETLERETAQMSEELEALRTRLQAEEKDVLALDHEQRKLAEEYARAGHRLSVARLELDRLAREEERLQQQHEASLGVVAEKEQARFNEEKALEEIRSAFEGEQANAHRISEEHATVRAELAGLDERRRSERSAETRLEQQVRELGQRKAFLANELERMGVERARLLTDNVELDQRAAALAEEILAVDGSVRTLAQRESEERLLLAALEEGLRALRAEVQGAQEKRSQLEVDLVRRQADLKYLDETSRKELNAGIEEVVAAVFGVAEGEAAEGEAAPAVVLDEAALADAEAKYLDVRQKIENLGPVNPQALEEFQEASLRYDFLNTQRQDLLDSIRDTEKAIQEIDVESKRRFTEAFHVINEHFKEMFKTLFGGGAAEMRLTDEQNVGESGIDIVASPPGKKLQNVLLLSGGEKSLTAMSLLMAIFRYQPSPFCILDEVDAPLDEPNIIRLTRLLKEMSAQTQFIVITHAKRTMETAQTLYGVTMQEPGISKLVSVKFEPLPEQAPLELAMAGSGR